MRAFDVVTVDVFTPRRFGGNQLAVFPAAEGLSDVEMQSLAAELNYSETTFVLPPSDPSCDARVRIFNRTSEMPFAGHPNVGTGFVLAVLAADTRDQFRFEEQAGIVEVHVQRNESGRPSGARIAAPQPLQLLGEVPPELIADCLSLMPADLQLSVHRPLRATVGVEFVLVEVRPEKLSAARPDMAAFREAANVIDVGDRLSIFLYARHDDGVRSRMFAPLSGTTEDPATGSANATLGALLLHLSSGDELTLRSVQGIEMARESRLLVHSWRSAEGVFASVAGDCVQVLRGRVSLA